MYSMMQAAKIIDQAFLFIPLEKAERVVNAYVWAIYSEPEIMLYAYDITRIKALILVWVSQSHADARAAVWAELDQSA